MLGFAAAFFVFVPGGCIAAVFFLHGLFHLLKSRRQGQNGTEYHGNSLLESTEEEGNDESIS
jgi:hypothetical protein